jgi:hypothetical protein
MTQLDHVKVDKLFIIPNGMDRFLSTEGNNKYIDFLPVLSDHGWRIMQSEPIYGASKPAQHYALYPDARVYLFAR